MADFSKIDWTFCQCQSGRGACVLVSYSIIINYFSDNKMLINDTLDHYATYANIKPYTSQCEKEDLISEHYHNACHPIDRRGLDYIADIHNYNGNTSCLCKTLEVKTGIIPLSQSILDELKEKLKKSDRLAMVVYPTPRGGHAVVIGWSNTNNSFFIKDPNCATPTSWVDKTLSISEYILFERN